MSSGAAAITREVTMQVVVPECTPRCLPVVMRYDVADPFAVCFEFQPTAPDGVAWVFARELLTRGLSAATGDGDVRVWPSDAAGNLRIALMSPDGDAVLDASASDVVDFLGHSYLVCPPGRESGHLDLDGAVRSLLAT